MGGAHSGDKQSRATQAERSSCVGLGVSPCRYGWTRRRALPRRAPRCLQTLLRVLSDPLSGAPATLDSCHGRRFLCEQILQETQSAVYRIMGCSWLRPRRALGANTDVHTERSGLCSSAMGSGAVPGRPTSRFSLSGAGTLPAPRRKKNKGIQEQTGRETRFPSLVSPKRFSLLCTAVKASLPPFPDQRPAGVWEVVSARARARGLPDMVHNTACV